MTLAAAGTASSFPLTDEQQAVVDSDARALVATASAGTGKTEILARRAERFVNDPNNGNAHVLVITYTTRAAHEFQARLHNRIGDLMHRISAETVHAFAQSILTIHGSHVGLPLDFQVITNDEDRAELLTGYDTCGEPGDYPELFRQLDHARATGRGHARLKSWRDAMDNRGAVDFSEMITKATEVLRIPAIAQMLRNIYGLVIVDEAQNLTEQQYQLITALVGRHAETGMPLVSTTLLGDPNQSVTGFAGGDSTLVKRFAHEYGARELALTQNFRSSKRLASLERIVSLELGGGQRRSGVRTECAAEGIIDCRDFPDEVAEGSFVAGWAARLLDEGLPPEAVSPGERCRVQSEDIAVLGRHSAALNSASAALVASGFEVARAHSDDDLMATFAWAVALQLMRFRSARHQLAALGALRRALGASDIDLASSGSDGARTAVADALSARADEHLDILIPLLDASSPSEFVGMLEQCQPPEAARDELLADWQADRFLIEEAWSEFTNTTPVAERSWTRFALHFDRAQRGRDLGMGIRLLTVHKAQAREFKAVAVVGMNDGQFPDFRATSQQEMQAELQAFYVATTRASRVLVLTRALVRPTRYGARMTEPSRYLQLIKRAKAQG